MLKSNSILQKISSYRKQQEGYLSTMDGFAETKYPNEERILSKKKNDGRRIYFKISLLNVNFF